MNKEDAEKVVRDTIEYANGEIAKSKRKYMKILCSALVVIAVLAILYFLLFRLTTPVAYSEGIVKVEIPEDEGLDIQINLSNYKSADAVLVKTGENAYDLYINITQTLATRLFDDGDTTNNLLRAGNGMVVDYQSESLQCYVPNGAGNEESIKRVYYVDVLSDKIAAMDDEELAAYDNKVLVWERT